MTRNFAYSAISAGSAALMVVLLTLAAGLLGQDQFGAFGYAITAATIAEVFMDFGLHQITIRAVAQKPDRAGHLLQTSIWLKIAPGIAMVTLGTATVALLRQEPDVRLASFIMFLSAAMRSYLLTARGILQGLERFADDAAVTIGDRVLLVGACSAALLAGAGLITLSLVFLAARVMSAGAALLLARARAGHGQTDRAVARAMVKDALPVGFFLLVLNLYNRIDTLMLGSMQGNQVTGRYVAAYTLYEGFTYAAAAVSAVLTPRLSSLWHQDRAAYRRVLGRGLLATTGLAVLVGAVTWPLASLVTAWLFPEYGSADVTLRLLLVGLPFIHVIWVLHAVAVSSHLTETLVRVTGVGIVINVGLNLSLIPRYAENGAAISTAISEALVMLLLFVFLRQALGRSPDERPAR